MKFFIFVLSIITFASSAKSLNFLNCPGLMDKENYYKAQWDYFKEEAKKSDIEQRIATIVNFYKKDCNDTQYIKSFEEEVKKQIHKGWKSQVKSLVKEAKRLSRYRIPTEELTKIDSYTKKLNKSRPQSISDENLENIIIKNKKNREKIKSKCSNIDNRKPPLSNYMRAQEGNAWCYAFTAADLLSHKTGKLISAFDIANSYNSSGDVFQFFKSSFANKRESQIEGGRALIALKKAKRKGLCTEENVRSSAYTVQSLVKSLEEIEELKDKFDRETYVAQAHRKNRDFWKKYKLRKKLINDFFCNTNLKGNFREVFNLIDSQMIQILENSSKHDVVNAAVNESCKNKRINIDEMKFVNKSKGFFTSSDDLISDIDEQLNKDNIVSISYFSSRLFSTKAKLSGDHNSSIVARKFNEKTGSCSYLIRNSWGEDCEGYSKKYTCEKGNIWVPQEYLTEMIHEITYIK